MPLKSSLYTAFLCLLFGANAVAIKISLNGLGAFTTAGLRFSIAAAAILLWVAFKHQALIINKKQVLQMVILSLLFVLQTSCIYIGFTKTTASHGIIITNLLPFFVLTLAHYFIPGEQITFKNGVGVTLGFLGIIFLFFDSSQMSGDLLAGDLMILFAVFFWGCNAVYTKRINKGFSAVQITWYPMIFGAPLFFLCGYFWDGQMVTSVNAAVLKALLFQSIAVTSFGFVAWNGLLRRFGATALHSFVFLMPVAGVFFGVLLLGEPLTGKLIVSMVLIVSGIIIVNNRSNRTG